MARYEVMIGYIIKSSRLLVCILCGGDAHDTFQRFSVCLFQFLCIFYSA